MSRHPSIRAFLPLMIAVVGLACASTPRGGADSLGPAGWSDGSAGLQPLLEALEKRDHDALYTGALTVLERCGTRPLGQQALLLLAAGELDPRNARGRPSVALEATEIVLRGVETGFWSGGLAASLHVVALRLGAEKAGLYAAAERELRDSSAKGNDGEAARDTEACLAAPWPEAGAGTDPPSMRGRSYPQLMIRLQQRVAELEEELERLRRITREP